MNYKEFGSNTPEETGSLDNEINLDATDCRTGEATPQGDDSMEILDSEEVCELTDVEDTTDQPAGDMGMEGILLSTNTTLPDSTADTIDLADLTLNSYNIDGLKITKAAATPIVGKPPKSSFITILDEEQWHGCSIAMIKHQSALGTDFYPVAPNMHSELEGEWKEMLLVPYITRDGQAGIWPIVSPNESSAGNTWTKSAYEIIMTFRGKWIRINSDMEMGQYTAREAMGDIPAPEWPFETLTTMFGAAFKGKVISNESHIVVRKLRGEI